MCITFFRVADTSHSICVDSNFTLSIAGTKESPRTAALMYAALASANFQIRVEPLQAVHFVFILCSQIALAVNINAIQVMKNIPIVEIPLGQF